MAGLLLLVSLLLRPSLAAERALYQQAVDRVQRDYLRPEQLDAGRALRLAAEAAAQAVPWLLVESTRLESGRERVRLVHGADGPFATVELLAGDGGWEGLPNALGQIEDAVVARAGREGLPGVDLPVELLRGAVRSLDRHTAVLAGDRLEAFNERLQGRLVGIGCRIGRQEGVPVITGVFAEGPARRAGLQEGDRLLRVDGHSTLGLDVDDVVERIRGEAGTLVQLLVERPRPDGGAQTLTVQLQREVVRIPNVEWERSPPGVGYIRVENFSQQTVRLVETALRELDGPEPVQGLVLDLRGNSGGSMLQAARLVDLFVDQGIILETGGRNFQAVEGLVQRVDAQPGGDPRSAALRLPLVVLIDRDSASASEIVAGSLALLGRAVLVGHQSYGKGTVQQPFTIGGAERPGGEVKLKLTIAEYRLAGHTFIPDGRGLQPDVAVETVRLGEAARAGELIRFSGDGLDIPPEVVRGEALGLLLGAEEPGGEGVNPGEDRLRTLAEEIAWTARGPRRPTILAAAAEVVATWRASEETRLVQALARRGIDWQAEGNCPRACPAPKVQATVRAVQPPIAGQPARLVAAVRNEGAEPVHRALLRLGADEPGLVWSNRVLPLGLLQPGQEVRAELELPVPSTLPARRDEVGLRLESDRRPDAQVGSATLEVGAGPPSVVQLSLQRVAPRPEELALGPDVVVVEARVRNLAGPALEGLRLRALPSTPDLPEPLLAEARLSALAAGAQGTLRLPLRAPVAAPTLRLPVELRADRVGVLISKGEIELGLEPVVLQAPTLHVDLPVAAPVGPLAVRLRAADDRRVEHLLVSLDGQKLAWRGAAGSSVDLELDLEVTVGSQVLSVEVRDDQGLQTRRRYVLLGEPRDGMAAP